MLSSKGRALLKKDLQSMDFTYNYEGHTWVPAMNVWRAGEGRERSLPHISIDFFPTSRKKFASISDLVDKHDINPEYNRHGYCELELVNVVVYANQHHSNSRVHGRLFCEWAIKKMRQRVLSRWEPILYEVQACLERSITPPISDVSAYLGTVGTKRYAYSMDVYLRTNVTWDYTPDDPDLIGSGVYARSTIIDPLEEMVSQDRQYIRIEFNP